VLIRTRVAKAVRIFILLACHNRAALTNRLLESLANQKFEKQQSLEIVAVDDGSTDNTPQVLENSGLVTEVIYGSGNLHWAKSMGLAETQAFQKIARVARAEQSCLLWLNDDVQLNLHAIQDAIIAVEANPNSVILGKTISKVDGKLTYGPLVRQGIHPLSFRLASASEEADPDAFNGNFVLIPSGVAMKVGSIEGRYRHGMADIDYAIRAKKLGISFVVLKNPIGFCERNVPKRHSKRLSAWDEFTGIKGAGNPESMGLLLKTTTTKWHFWMIATYVFWWLRRLRKAPYYLA